MDTTGVSRLSSFEKEKEHAERLVNHFFRSVVMAMLPDLPYLLSKHSVRGVCGLVFVIGRSHICLFVTF